MTAAKMIVGRIHLERMNAVKISGRRMSAWGRMAIRMITSGESLEAEVSSLFLHKLMKSFI